MFSALDFDRVFDMIRSEVVRVQGDTTDLLLPTAPDDVTSCTGAATTSATGLTFCYRTGSVPWDMNVYIVKEDLPQGFTMEVGLKNPADYAGGHVTDLARFTVNTPGSAVDREFLAQVAFDRELSNIEVEFKTPWKDVSGRMRYVNVASEKTAELKLTVNDDVAVHALASAQIADHDITTELKLILPWIDNITALGVIELNDGDGVTSLEVHVSQQGQVVLRLAGIISVICFLNTYFNLRI